MKDLMKSVNCYVVSEMKQGEVRIKTRFQLNYLNSEMKHFCDAMVGIEEKSVILS